ncbi:hypothetical protein QUF65_14120 [Lysinibacillus sphaericus]|nr:MULTISPECIES: hypothetical protein [Lysinibacillus]MBE5082725.1 hypothetical protein [Bacillus thuringiensis]MDM5352023.1 hypothetical protein [Lysinibacillus sphaericus]QTB12540.1 hypothetical protein J2B92_17000 [Lysinibacillus sphaericus]QTB21427.1 hypothetical protein J1907_16965 [Lysinibacillus sphaericus]
MVIQQILRYMSLTITYVNGEKISNDFVNFIESVEVTDDEETVSLKLKIGYRLFPIIKVVV